jgi:outer membrane protein, heavy metal efflux system
MRIDGVTLALALSLAAAGCATRLPPETPSNLVQRTGVPERPPDAEGTALPPGVVVDDGLTQDEAVAIALWNNPDFQVQLADLGFARAPAGSRPAMSSTRWRRTGCDSPISRSPSSNT